MKYRVGERKIIKYISKNSEGLKVILQSFVSTEKIVSRGI